MFQQPPAVSRQRGLPAIGFQLELPLAPDGEPDCVYCEHRRDGRVVGELSVEVFAAPLIIDRDGILEATASGATGTPAVAVVLPGATGYRAEAVRGGPLPYHYVFAIAPGDAVDGGVVVTIRCAHPDWPVAEQALRSLRILTRNGIAPANDDAPLLPLIGD